jgi:uncharacterized membrane protein YkvA (DUF1232 family)
VLIAVTSTLALTWLGLVGLLAWVRPRGSLLQEGLRILPDTLRLLGQLATDRSLSRGIRVRLWLLFAYVGMPFDIVPDFIPILGYADDVIMVCIVLRSVVRRAGADAVRRHWTGSDDGLAVLWRLARLPDPSPSDTCER